MATHDAGSRRAPGPLGYPPPERYGPVRFGPVGPDGYSALILPATPGHASSDGPTIPSPRTAHHDALPRPVVADSGPTPHPAVVERARGAGRHGRRSGRPLAAVGTLVGAVALVAGAVGVAVTVHPASTVAAPAAASPVSVAPAAAQETPALASSVRYEATGSGRGTVTYVDGAGSRTRPSSTALPWNRTVTPGDETTDYYAVTVSGPGRVGCRIVKDGQVIAQRTAPGSVTCSGS